MSEQPEVKTAEDVLLRIASAHWDFAACRCWVCRTADRLGIGCYERWRGREMDAKYPVPVDAFDAKDVK